MENSIKDFYDGEGYFSDYKTFSFVDGEGIRNSLYVSGCRLKCKNCFNKNAQNFKNGFPFFENQMMETILKDLENEHIDGLSILGGEPMLNLKIVLPLVKKVKEEFPDKDIWLWSGFKWEQLSRNPYQKEVLNYIDILVDGPYIEELRVLNKDFFGSSNQRIIDVQKSIEEEKIVLR